MLDPALILLVMLSLQPAGSSIYSQTVVPADSGAACDNPYSLLCAAPKPNPEWDGQHTRPETEQEGRARYAMIAGAIARVAERMTWRKHPRCQPATIARWSNVKPPKECERAWRARPWQSTSKQLVHYLLTVTYSESGFRRDVHAGKGTMSKGDPDKYGKGQSWCLGQRKLGATGSAKTKRGWRARDLVGLDVKSTERCLATAVDVLARARNVCRSPWGPEARGPVCIFGVYGGIWASTGNKSILARVRSYHKVLRLEKMHMAPKLSAAREPAPEQDTSWWN